MMKKNITIITIVSIFSVGSILAALGPRAIRKDLEAKYAQGLLNECQLMEDNLTFLEVLDRDICIIEEHKKSLEWRIYGNKGFLCGVLCHFSRP